MTREEAKRLLEKMMPQQRRDIKSIPHLIITEAFSVAIKALEQQPCEDCISREAVLEILEKEEFKGDAIYEIEKKLPPVTPTRPTGKWIKMPLIEAGQTYSHECSLCGRRILITDVGLSEFPYCHCGARMEESEEEE